ncbi:MAG: membrane dipeptidase [Xanthomonadales bacterium]|nr:membrane dipeptidase [Xanthomonadales bacterium]
MTLHRLAACAAFIIGAAANAAEQGDLHARAVELTRQYPLVDTHIDVPYRIHASWADVTRATAEGDFDFPRAKAGGLDVPFMSIYTPPELEHRGGAFQLANELIDGVEALVGRAPDRFVMVHSADDAEAAFKQGKIGLALGMENGSPIEGKLENIAHFAQRGIRYITLAHSESNHISDSSFDEARPNGGLSEFGREVVAEMNRHGVMVDVSHLSDEAIFDVLEVSATPVIASHSSARHLTPGFERNISDDLIRAVAAGGGVVMINFGSSFIMPEANDYLVRMRAERNAYLDEHAYPADGPEASAWVVEFRARHPFPFATLAQVADHFDHVIGLVGVDHVGIGSDYDGVGDSLPTGLKDVSTYPNLVAELLRRGYAEADIKKILGANLLRAWRANEAYASSR